VPAFDETGTRLRVRCIFTGRPDSKTLLSSDEDGGVFVLPAQDAHMRDRPLLAEVQHDQDRIEIDQDHTEQKHGWTETTLTDVDGGLSVLGKWWIGL
jgi:hypothetical protein